MPCSTIGAKCIESKFIGVNTRCDFWIIALTIFDAAFGEFVALCITPRTIFMGTHLFLNFDDLSGRSIEFSAVGILPGMDGHQHPANVF